jgi:hypothetical protein
LRRRQVTDAERLGDVAGGITLRLQDVKPFTFELGAYTVDVVGAQAKNMTHRLRIQLDAVPPAAH